MIHVVTGHICAGKSTYVRERATGADVVIDMDRIALAIAVEGTPHHAYGEHIREIARRARRVIMDEAIRRHGQGGFDVWIVHAYPTPAEVGYYLSIGAGVIEITCDTATLIDRAERERPPSMRRILRERSA